MNSREVFLKKESGACDLLLWLQEFGEKAPVTEDKV